MQQQCGQLTLPRQRWISLVHFNSKMPRLPFGISVYVGCNGEIGGSILEHSSTVEDMGIMVNNL